MRYVLAVIVAAAALLAGCDVLFPSTTPAGPTGMPAAPSGAPRLSPTIEIPPPR